MLCCYQDQAVKETYQVKLNLLSINKQVKLELDLQSIGSSPDLQRQLIRACQIQ